MRKTLLIAMALCSMMSVQAKEISETEAARIASQFVNSKMAVTRSGDSKLQLAKSSQGYYAYNRGNSNGFVVVAADDNMGSQVLGYADSGTLDFSNMPTNLKWWLSQYDSWATNVASNPVASTRAEATSREPIEQLITCQWDQDAPLNDLCPEYKAGKKSATGCAATAMAQVMYYHKWPKQGTGSISYYWETGKKTLSADFTQSTYDWDSMTDTYDSNSSAASKTAVAVLMRDCGYATKMDYGDESATETMFQTVALVKYFNYDKAIRTVGRYQFTYDDWNTMLYNELANKRPILMSGGSHAFIFDGYKDGYYHVNWGWGGKSDGYFLCSDLTPASQGIGSTGSSYSANLVATIGIQKPLEGSTANMELVLTGNFMPMEAVVEQGTGFVSESQILNYSPCDSIFYMGLKVCKQGNTDTIYVKNAEPTTLNPSDEGNSDVSFSLNGFPTEDGVYNVYPVCMRENDDTWYDLQAPITCSPYCVATVKGDSIYFNNGTIADLPTATDIQVVENKVYAGTKFHVTATITATNNDYCSPLYLAIIKDGESDSPVCQSYIDLRKGESTTVTFEATAPEKAGEYSLLIASKTGLLEAMGTVTVLDVPTGELKLEFSDIYTGDGEVDPADLFFGCVLKCTSGMFQGPVGVAIIDPETKEVAGVLTSDSYTVVEGDSAIVTISGSVEELEYGKTYNVLFLALQDEEPVAKSDYFEITTIKSSGISGITNGGELQPIRIYTLNGKLVATQKATEPSLNALPQGTYIIKVGNNKAKKIINR